MVFTAVLVSDLTKDGESGEAGFYVSYDTVIHKITITAYIVPVLAVRHQISLDRFAAIQFFEQASYSGLISLMNIRRVRRNATGDMQSGAVPKIFHEC